MTIKEKLAAWYAKQFIAWSEAKTKLSIWWNGLLIVGGGFWILLPSDVQNSIITAVLDSFGMPTSWAVVVIGVMGALARLKKQEPKE